MTTKNNAPTRTTMDGLKDLTASIPGVILSGNETDVLKLRKRIEALRKEVSTMTKAFDDKLIGLRFATPDAYPTLKSMNDNEGCFRNRKRDDLRKSAPADDADLFDF